MKQFGAKVQVLRWQAQVGKPLPEAVPTRVVRIACFQSLVFDKMLGERSKNVKAAAKAWLSMLRIPQSDVIDMFSPRRSED